MTFDGVTICIVAVAVIFNGLTIMRMQKRIDALEAQAAKAKAA